MSKQKKPRNKKYAPRQLSVNPLSEIFGGMSDAHQPHLQRLLVVNSLALQAIVQGRGTRDDWDKLVGAVNMGNVMCEMGIGNEFRGAMIAGRDALCEVGKRYMRSERFVFTGAELKAVNEAVACHTAQLENVRAVDVGRASAEVIRRIQYGVNTTNVRKEFNKEQA